MSDESDIGVVFGSDARMSGGGTWTSAALVVIEDEAEIVAGRDGIGEIAISVAIELS